MRPLLKLVGVFSIVALSGAKSPAQIGDPSLTIDDLSDQAVCRRAINSNRSGWAEGPYAGEASKRGLTFRACDEMNNLPAGNRQLSIDKAPTIPAGAEGDEECVGVFQVIRTERTKYPKGVSLAQCEFDKTPTAEIEKIIKVCGRPYNVTHQPEPDNPIICRVRVVAEGTSHGSFDVQKVLSVSRTTPAEARRAAERYLKKQGLMPEDSPLEGYLNEMGNRFHTPTPPMPSGLK